MHRRLVCLFRRHDWHSEHDHESRHTNWTCPRCGLHKITVDEFWDTSGGGPSNVNLYGGGG